MRKLVLFTILLIMLAPSIKATEEVEIKVAIYFSNIKAYTDEIKESIDYLWIKNSIKYIITSDIINKEDVMTGKLTSYDILIIPGSGRPYVDAINVKWREEVIKFVENGGGYLGICGGANLASMGFREKCSPNSILNLSILKIANIYVNNEQNEEWQYLWKSNWEQGLPPINVYIPNVANPIFKGYYETNRSIRYGGGPGMYPAHCDNEKCGEIVPLAIYAEEPMEIAPIHYWRWRNDWEIVANVTTNIKNQYAAIASTYGKGRIVLFSPHPEKKTYFGGYIEEVPVRPNMTPFTWFMYNWISDNSSTISYNWWILRRSIAWLADYDVPDISEIAVSIEEPRYGIYLKGRKIGFSQKNIVIGYTCLIGEAINSTETFLYVDGKFMCMGNRKINFKLDLSIGKHNIRVIAKNEKEEAGNEIEVLFI